MRKINKLVRDNIPQIIEKQGQKCSVKILNNNEYNIQLNKKLVEEVQEYLESESIEELADIVEVLWAILNFKKMSHKEFEKIRLNKVKLNGGFQNRIFLESIE